MQFNTPRKEDFRTAGITLLAIVGIIALLALATWGTVQVARVAPQTFTNLTAAVTNFTSQFFPADRATLVFTMPSRNAESDEPYTFSWSTDAQVEDYSFSYECRDGLTFSIPGSLTEGEIPCGESYTFRSTGNTLTLIPESKNNRFLDVSVTLSAQTDSEAVSGTTLLTLVNEDVSDSRGTIENGAVGTGGGVPTGPGTPSTEVQPIGGGAVTTTPIPSDPLGKPDLFVRVIAIGKIDENTNAFVATNTITEDDEAAVRFEVMNLGTKTSGAWNFRAELPTSPSHTFTPREDQQSLQPGDRIEYTLAFDRVRERDGIGTVTIDIDPFRNLDEYSRENNTATTIFSILED